jgi:hypothetical protein
MAGDEATGADEGVECCSPSASSGQTALYIYLTTPCKHTSDGSQPGVPAFCPGTKKSLGP